MLRSLFLLKNGKGDFVQRSADYNYATSLCAVNSLLRALCDTAGLRLDRTGARRILPIEQRQDDFAVADMAWPAQISLFIT
jgi:hypothetical protein